MRRFFKSLKQMVVVTLLLCGMSQAAWAESFVIKSIQVQGLHHLSKSTVLSYVPVSVGNTFTDTSSGKIITTLYRLGYFDNIQVSTEGSMVIIKVAERPTIGILTVSGNKSITKKQLAPV